MVRLHSAGVPDRAGRDRWAQALEFLKTARPDLILLDVMMLRMDGPASFAGIRGGHGIPVIFMTARVRR